MNIYPILPFIAFFTNLTLACFVIYVNPKSKINQLFTLVLLSVALWSIGNFHTFTALSSNNAVFWGKIGTLGATLTGTFLLHFFLLFTKSKFIKKRINIVLLYIPASFFIVINIFTNFIATSVTPVYWGYFQNKGVLYYPYSLYIIIFIILGFITCYKFYLKRANKEEKIQAKFLIFAISIPLIGGILSEVVLPLIDINFMPLSTTLTTLMSIIIASVIVKYNLMTPFSFSIQKKLTASFLTIVIVVSTISIFSTTQGQTLFYDNIGSGSSLLAKGTMDKIDRSITNRIEEFELLVTSSNVQDFVNDSNNEFSLIGTNEDINNYIIEIDNNWIHSIDNESLNFKEKLLNNNLSKELQKYLDYYKEKYNYSLIGEIFITNKYGANIGQTGITSDYYQADEDWWIETKEKGYHYGHIEYDESAGIYSLDIILIINDDNDNFIGIIKVVWNIEEIINILKDSIVTSGFDQFSSMNYKLLDKDGRLIYSTEEFEFLSDQFYLINFIESNTIDNDNSYLILNESENVENENLIAFAFSNDYDYFHFLRFVLIVEHDANEIFFEFNNLRNLILSISIFTIIIGLILGYLISRSISKPIIKLRDATSSIGRGNLNTKIDFKSNDELGELSHSFNQMTKSLKESKKQINSYSKQLEKTLKQKDEFINQLGHDLKNPLGPLINLIPVLEKNEKDLKKIEVLKIIHRNVDYMKNLVVKTIALARLNSSNTKFSFEETNLLNEFNNVIEQNKLLFKDNNITVKNNINENLFVNADKLRLTELLNNILNNSVKYSKNSGEIILDSIEEDEFIKISIKDNGIGMTNDQMTQIFDEFYKADSSRHDFESSGLGLPICKRIVEKHGGKIWVESDGIGKGSTFFFTIKKINKNQEFDNNINELTNDEIKKSTNNEDIFNQIDNFLDGKNKS